MSLFPKPADWLPAQNLVNIKFQYRHLAKRTVQYLVKISLNTTILICRLLIDLYIQRQQKDVPDLQFRASWFMTQNKCNIAVFITLWAFIVLFPTWKYVFQVNLKNTTLIVRICLQLTITDLVRRQQMLFWRRHLHFCED